MFDQRWQMVSCVACGRHYQCTPSDDYYNCTNDHDGLCEGCLLYANDLRPEDVHDLRDGTS